MLAELDHIAFAAESLDAATAAAEAALGVSMAPGGQHDVFVTHNTLIGLDDGLYLEAIATDPARPAPDRPRWFDLDRFAGPPRLTNWICRTRDIEAALAVAPEGAGRPVALSRGDLRWRMAVPDSGILPFDNCFPALMQWDCDAHPASRLPSSGLRLTRLTITHPEAEALGAALAPLISDTKIDVAEGRPGITADLDGPNGPIRL